MPSIRVVFWLLANTLLALLLLYLPFGACSMAPPPDPEVCCPREPDSSCTDVDGCMLSVAGKSPRLCVPVDFQDLDSPSKAGVCQPLSARCAQYGETDCQAYPYCRARFDDVGSFERCESRFPGQAE